MRLNDENAARARLQMQEDWVRAVVREEIGRALDALSRSADACDVTYETSEIDSRAYQAGKEAARAALTALRRCWTEGHTFNDIWGQAMPDCTRCGAPAPDPFEEKTDG